MRIGAEAAGGIGNAHGIEQFERALAGGGGAQAAMDRQHLADLPLDGMDRIERTHRLLEDHGNVIAAHGAQVGRWGGH
ncbi:hypothetical protein D3C87_1957730 [compost metagenome]